MLSQTVCIPKPIISAWFCTIFGKDLFFKSFCSLTRASKLLIVTLIAIIKD